MGGYADKTCLLLLQLLLTQLFLTCATARILLVVGHFEISFFL